MIEAVMVGVVAVILALAVAHAAKEVAAERRGMDENLRTEGRGSVNDWNIEVLEDRSIVETYSKPGPIVVSRRILLERVAYSILETNEPKPRRVVLLAVGGFDFEAGADVEAPDDALAVGIAMTPAVARNVAQLLIDQADAAESAR